MGEGKGLGVKIWQVLVIRELDMIYIDCGLSNFKSLFTTWRLGLTLNDFSSVGDNVTLGQLQHGSVFFSVHQVLRKFHMTIG